MRVSELREMTQEQLEEELENTRQELFNLRFRLATRQLVNHREVHRVKKEIARLQTIMKERELGIR